MARGGAEEEWECSPLGLLLQGLEAEDMTQEAHKVVCTEAIFIFFLGYLFFLSAIYKMN